MKARAIIESEPDDLKGELLAGQLFEFRPGDVVRNAQGHWPEMKGVVSHMIGSTNKETWWYVKWGRDPSLDGTFRASALELVERPEAQHVEESESDDLKGEILPQPWLEDYGRANKFKWDANYNAWKKRIKLEQGYADMLLYPGGNLVKILIKLAGQPTLMATTRTTDPDTGARAPRVLQRLEKSLAEYSAWDLSEYRLWLSQVGFRVGQ